MVIDIIIHQDNYDKQKLYSQIIHHFKQAVGHTSGKATQTLNNAPITRKSTETLAKERRRLRRKGH